MNRMPDHHHPLDSSSSRPLHLRGSITNINSANIIDKIIRDRRRLEDEDVNYWRKRAGWADDDETMKQYNEGIHYGEQTTQTVTNQAKDQVKDHMVWNILGLISSVIFVVMLARCCTSVLCGSSKKHKSKSVDSSGSRSVRGEKNGERRSRSRSRTRSKSRSRSKKRSSRDEKKKKSSSKSNKEGGDSDTSSDYKLMDDDNNNDDNKSSKSSRSRSRSRITGRSRSKSKTRSSKSKTPRLSIGGESTSGDEKSSVKSSGSGKKKDKKKSSGDDMDKKKMLV